MKPLDEAELDVLESLAAALSQHTVEPNAQLFGEPLRRAVFALREYRRVAPAEERAAFDAYYCACRVAGMHDAAALETVNRMLAQRRERFGGSQ